MNIYELAKAAVETKESWYGGESVDIYTNAKYKVVIKRDSLGQLRMFVVVLGDVKKNATVASVEIRVGTPHNFTMDQQQYNRWVSRVKDRI